MLLTIIITVTVFTERRLAVHVAKSLSTLAALFLSNVMQLYNTHVIACACAKHMHVYVNVCIRYV